MQLFSKRYHEPGTMPGTLTEHGNGGYTLILENYDADQLFEEKGTDLSKCKSFIGHPGTTWIHVQGEPSLEALFSLAENFGIHTLYLEDIVNKGQRPKLDFGDNEIFLILSLPIEGDGHFSLEQVSLFFDGKTVVSFCSGMHNPFELIYERLHQPIGKLRKHGSGYLFYSLIDTIIDNGFPVLEAYAEKIQKVEDDLIENPGESILHEIHRLRRELLLLHRRLWPHRDVINSLIRDTEEGTFEKDTSIYFRDCYDHTIAILELLETYREMTSGMLEVYLSSVSQRLNEVMRVLTIIATLFIPPTFIVGVYGMNFSNQASAYNMPELTWPFGYVMVWLLIIFMISSMLVYFRRKRWL